MCNLIKKGPKDGKWSCKGWFIKSDKTILNSQGNCSNVFSNKKCINHYL